MSRDHFYTLGNMYGYYYEERGYRKENDLGFAFPFDPTGDRELAKAGTWNPDWGKLIPIYCWYSSSRNDHLYPLANQVDDLIRAWRSENNKDGYEPVGKTCFWLLHREQVANTVPVYCWWSESASDHFYNTEHTKDTLTSLGYVYLGILGYIYKEEQPGTGAIHQYCRD